MKTDYIEKIDGAERRWAVAGMQVEKRVSEDGIESFVVRGYAALYDVVTIIGGYFREVVRKGFFTPVLNDDVRCLFNHNPDKVLARCINGKGTLRIGEDEKGLWYEYNTPKRQYAIDLADAIEAGDVSQSSFAFSPKETRWTEQEGELDLRELVVCEKLYDVSPVTYPAYDGTTVGKRCHDVFLAEKAKELEVRGESSAEDKGLSLTAAQLIINENL